jgi:putative Mg2+ transporter-C (MgtC) family protein
MGLAIGAGFYECVVIGFALILLSIRILPGVERWIVSRARNMNIYLELDTMEHLGAAINRMKAEGLELFDVEIEKNASGSGTLCGTFTVRLHQRQQHVELLARLSALDGVLAVEEV